MGLSKHIPKYRKFDIFHAELIQRKSQEQKEAGLSKKFWPSLCRKLDIWSAVFSDLTAHEHYDVVIVGSDIQLNLIAAHKMHLSGKKVLIDYKPTLDESNNAWQKLQRCRNEMFSYNLSLVVSHYSGVKPTDNYEEFLGSLSSLELYGHSSGSDLPILNTEYSFLYCSELTESEIYGYQCHEEEFEFAPYTKRLRTNLPVLKLLDVPVDGDKGCMPRYIMSCDKIIVTSEDCQIRPTVSEDRIVRIGGAARSTKDYKDFTVADRLDDFEDAYDILSKI
ncbi:hypothetical protein [Vibrio owensii]|uniref:hypothetical protein n=1 Tax=Vibrio harveyi group TaxID=717610 RepID=UPI003CC5477C